MAGRDQYAWPDDDELVEIVVRHGTITAAAAAMGRNPVTLDGRLRRKGLRERVHEGWAAARGPLVINDAPAKPDRLAMALQEIAELKKALKRERDDDVRFERIVHTIESVAPAKEPTYKPAKPPKAKAPKRPKAHTLVLMWSDQHAGEVVSAEETRGLGEYDWQIMLQRHDILRDRLLSWAEKFNPVERLVIAALGDGVSGDIHDELAETNELPMDESIVQWGLDGGEWIESLVPEFPEIHVVGVRGNHSRRTKKPRMKKGYSSGDWQAMHFMAQRLRKYSSVTFDIPRATKHTIDIYGRRVLVMHGDQVPASTMVGVPWGGVIRYAEKIGRSEPFDHLLMGHFHQPNAIDKRIFVNGAIKGVDEYILERHGTGAPPCQVLLPFHPEHGVCGAQYIDLSAA